MFFEFFNGQNLGWKIVGFLPIGKYYPKHLSHTWIFYRPKDFFLVPWTSIVLFF